MTPVIYEKSDENQCMTSEDMGCDKQMSMVGFPKKPDTSKIRNCFMIIDENHNVKTVR